MTYDIQNVQEYFRTNLDDGLYLIERIFYNDEKMEELKYDILSDLPDLLTRTLDPQVERPRFEWYGDDGYDPSVDDGNCYLDGSMIVAIVTARTSYWVGDIECLMDGDKYRLEFSANIEATLTVRLSHRHFRGLMTATEDGEISDMEVAIQSDPLLIKGDFQHD